MPWTFAHPAAVLPLRRLGSVRLSLSALVTGSLTPDFGYYLFRFQGSAFAHSLIGSLTLCVAVGLLLLGAFYVLRAPLCYMLPQPHRAALMPLAAEKWRFGMAELAVVVASLVLGAWTHIVWDSFTHVDRWFVDRIGWLQLRVVTLRGHDFYGYALLQYASSVLGVGVLLWAYGGWLRRCSDGHWLRIERSDTWRYVSILATAALAVCVAVPWAMTTARSPDGLFGLRIFVVKSIVVATSLFIASFIATAVVCYSRRPRPADTYDSTA